MNIQMSRFAKDKNPDDAFYETKITVAPVLFTWITPFAIIAIGSHMYQPVLAYLFMWCPTTAHRTPLMTSLFLIPILP
jgi:hypothetical protein